MSVVALVLAAERGERLGGSVPTALVPVRGQPLLVHAVRGLVDAGCVHEVVVAAPGSDVDLMGKALVSAGLDALVVAGGTTRTQSVRRALDAAGDPRIVLVHEAARAFTPAQLIREVVAAVEAGAPAVLPVLPVADTVKRVGGDGVVLATPERSRLRVLQTPQGFAAAVLRRAYDTLPDDAAGSGAGLVERLGVPAATVRGHAHAMKITTRFDLAVVEAMLS